MGQLICTNNGENNNIDVNVPTVPMWKAVYSVVLIFTVYVGVQVVGQVYPVLFPAGMRCYANNTYSCSNMSTLFISESECAPSTGCLEFGDVQQGILTGLTFTSVYFVAGIPLVRAASAGSCVFMLGLGQPILIAMTIVTALSNDFLILWVGRLGVAFVEAVCSPAAYYLITEYFLAMNRPKALSFYYIATNFGIAIAYLLGIVNSELCWRWVFYCLAIVGAVFFFLIVLFLRNPPYDSSDSLMNSRDIYTIKDVIQRLGSNKPYVLLCAASSIRYISTYALWAWLPTFYAKVRQIPSWDYGLKVAFVVLCGGVSGCIIGGTLAERISRRRKHYKAYLVALSQLAASSLIVASLLVKTAATSFVLLFLYCITAEISPEPAASIVKDLFAMNLRSQASIVYIAVGNIVGGTIGPILVPGLMAFGLSWHQCDQGVGVALAIIVPLFNLLASVLYVITGSLMPSNPILSEETIYLKYETSEVNSDSDTERETLFYGSQSC